MSLFSIWFSSYGDHCLEFFSFNLKNTFLLASIVLNIKMVLNINQIPPPPWKCDHPIYGENTAPVPFLHSFCLHLASVLTIPCRSGTERPGQAPKTNGTWNRRDECLDTELIFRFQVLFFSGPSQTQVSSIKPRRGAWAFLLVSCGLWTWWEVTCEGCSPAPHRPWGSQESGLPAGRCEPMTNGTWLQGKIDSGKLLMPSFIMFGMKYCIRFLMRMGTTSDQFNKAFSRRREHAWIEKENNPVLKASRGPPFLPIAGFAHSFILTPVL